MGMLIFGLIVAFFVLLSALSIFVTYWIELWFLKLFIDRPSTCYIIVALFNVTFALASLASQPSRLIGFLLVGAPILGFMWHREVNSPTPRPSAKRG